MPHLPVDAICHGKSFGVQMDTHIAPRLDDAVSLQAAGGLLLVGGRTAECLQPGLSNSMHASDFVWGNASWSGRVHWAVVDSSKAQQGQYAIGWEGQVVGEERREQARLTG